jgi:hypothetical protein
MTTVTSNPVRTDLATSEPVVADRTTTPSRSWALAGVGAGLLGAGTVVLSGAAGYIYDDRFAHGSSAGAADAMADKSGLLLAFHSVTALSAVLLLVFAAGLHRRLRAAAPDSLAATVALVGLAGTAVVSVLGSGLDTEFALTGGDVRVDDATAAFYGHWVGTIPWLWTLTGLAGLAVFVVARAGGLARWQGWVGLVLGGLTVLLGVSPAEYMAGLTGVLWVLVASIGFAVGDRR